jgi:hypothetical protein|tara:strand:- start:5 stop:319 length:315 start_codon:yes stop_codon:yes gene_type:complete
MDDKKMQDPAIVMVALDAAMKGDKEMPKAPAKEGPSETPPEMSPEEMEEKQADLYMAVYGEEYNPESEEQRPMMEQIVAKMQEPDYAELNPTQFALKMLREMAM